MTLTPGCPEDHSSVPSGGTRQALRTGRETTRNHEKWGTWQWAQSRWAWGWGRRGVGVRAEPQAGVPPRGPEGPSPSGFLLPGGSRGHSSCRGSASSPPPPGSAGTSGAQTAATSPPPAGRGRGQLRGWGGRAGPLHLPRPLWPCLLEGHPVGLQLQDAAEQGVMGAQGDEARLRQPQAVADGDGARGGPSRELQADAAGQGHGAAVRGHGEAEGGQGRRQVRLRGACVSAPGTRRGLRKAPEQGPGVWRGQVAQGSSSLTPPPPQTCHNLKSGTAWAFPGPRVTLRKDR